MITRIQIENYKSLKDVDTLLGSVQLLIGANASGKSNFADSLDFLSHVFREGLRTAVSRFGGYHNITFRRARRSKGGVAFTLSASADWRSPLFMRQKHKGESLRVEYHYHFHLRAHGEAIASEYSVQSEKLDLSAPSPSGPAVHIATFERSGSQMTVRPNPTLQPTVDPLGRLIGHIGRLVDAPFLDMEPDELALAPGQPLFGMSFCRPLVSLLANTRVFQVYPTIARQPASPSPRPELGRHGQDLASTVAWLERIHPAIHDHLQTKLREAVPTITHVHTRYTDMKQLGLYFQEAGVNEPWHSTDISDGTVQLLALLVGILDPRSSIVVIEEPENSLHPWILRSFIREALAASSAKQVIITTHAPLAVAQAPVDSLLIAERRRGHTTITRAVERFSGIREAVAAGSADLGELWTAGEIEAVPNPLEVHDEEDVP